MVGTVLYGLAFFWLAPYFWGDDLWVRGLVLGAIGWLIAMLAMLPMAGKGFFGMKIGIMAPAMSLMMHLLFGGVLGWLYAFLAGT